MSNGKVSPYWYDLNRILRAIIQEMDKEPHPDWSKIFTHAQDLAALSQEALKQPRDKNALP